MEVNLNPNPKANVCEDPFWTSWSLSTLLWLSRLIIIIIRKEILH